MRSGSATSHRTQSRTFFQVADDRVGNPRVDVLLVGSLHCFSPLRAFKKLHSLVVERFCAERSEQSPGSRFVWLATALPLTAERAVSALEAQPIEVSQPRYGDPVTVSASGARLISTIVTDSYNRRCGFTNSPVLHVLEAAHIRPYSSGGTHAPSIYVTILIRLEANEITLSAPFGRVDLEALKGGRPTSPAECNWFSRNVRTKTTGGAPLLAFREGATRSSTLNSHLF